MGREDGKPCEIEGSNIRSNSYFFLFTLRELSLHTSAIFTHEFPNSNTIIEYSNNNRKNEEVREHVEFHWDDMKDVWMDE